MCITITYIHVLNTALYYLISWPEEGDAMSVALKAIHSIKEEAWILLHYQNSPQDVINES